MNVFITGANFGNKGAQSMLFTTVSEIRRHFPDVKIIFGHGKTPCLHGKFSFDEVYWTRNGLKISKNKIVAGKFPAWCSAKKTIETIKNSDLIIDVSGFALGSKWGVKNSLAYLNSINVARALGVPMILFPQSFGSFEFANSQKKLDSEIKNIMPYPEKIFARERDGFIPLRDKYGLKNISLHPDIVLSGRKLNPADFYQMKLGSEASCVGVVPNLRSFDKGNRWQTLQIFYEIINFLLAEKKRVYLFRHSVEDIAPCTWLKNLFPDDERVILWKNDFSCFEYDEVCRQFDFLIAGRFHGIVHAYRNNVPCLLLGWAVKYRELAQLMYQSQYIFDITAPKIDVRNIFASIRDMENNLKLNKEILRQRLEQVQMRSICFDSAIKILSRAEEKAS